MEVVIVTFLSCRHALTDLVIAMVPYVSENRLKVAASQVTKHLKVLHLIHLWNLVLTGQVYVSRFI